MTACSSDDRKAVLRYGKQEVAIDLAEAGSVTYLYANEMPAVTNLEKTVISSFEENCIGKGLRDRIVKGDKVTIVISDLTRFWMRQDRITEILVKYLERECGIKDEDIAVLVALGTHRKMTDAELEVLAGSYVYSRCMVVNHDCDSEDLVDIGVTSFGNHIEVNPLAVGRKLIVISGTIHHLMAGYGGGRKSILPGISSRMTIRRNHSMALDPNAPQTSVYVGSGQLTENPINEDMEEAARLAVPTFGISIVINNQAEHAGIFSGDFFEAWKESCAFCQKYYGKEIHEETDVVIASCGGYPKDLNLYQGVKSLLNGVNAMKQGGTFVFLCECSEGGGAPDFFDWSKPLSEGRLDPALREAFTIGGYIFYASCEAICKAGKFLMLSELDPALVKDMKIEAYTTIEELQKKLDLKGKSVTVIPYGGYVLPQNPKTFDRLNSEF